MRKLKLQTQMSVDGFIAGPNGEMDWMVWDWDDKLNDHVGALTQPVGISSCSAASSPMVSSPPGSSDSNRTLPISPRDSSWRPPR